MRDDFCPRVLGKAPQVRICIKSHLPIVIPPTCLYGFLKATSNTVFLLHLPMFWLLSYPLVKPPPSQTWWSQQRNFLLQLPIHIVVSSFLVYFPSGCDLLLNPEDGMFLLESFSEPASYPGFPVSIACSTVSFPFAMSKSHKEKLMKRVQDHTEKHL